MARIFRDWRHAALAAIVLVAAPMAVAGSAEAAACIAGITLPKGFCATIFADKVGPARQMAVGRDGTLYVNTWSRADYGNDKPRPAASCWPSRIPREPASPM
jgi:hypothetical protein